MKELIKQISELVNAQLGIVNIDDGSKTVYGINYISINDDEIACDTIASQTHFINIDWIKSIKYIVTQ